MTDAAIRAKATLTRIRRIESEIRAKNDQIQQLREAAYLGPPGGSGSSGSVKSRVEENTVRAVDLIARLEEQKAEALELRQTAMMVISRIEDDRCRTLLELRYLSGKSWRSVMEIMYISEATSKRLHVRALTAYAAASETVKDDDLTQIDTK